MVPLYISILFRLMKEKGTHEGCIEQMERLFRDFVYTGKPIVTDAEDRVRIDDLEMQADVQAGVEKLWSTVNTDNIQSITDIAGYRRDFYRLFGFEVDGVDYSADVNIDVKIPSVE
ncbi:MAG: trans-2-enoyl-CoA reductase [uncultured bacterium]|nr:MAG: trans-2-enoyl-CoA reductase [uncultured bacterium]